MAILNGLVFEAGEEEVEEEEVNEMVVGWLVGGHVTAAHQVTQEGHGDVRVKGQTVVVVDVVVVLFLVPEGVF